MPSATHKYTNGEITIVWKPATCIHSTICWKGLYKVFNPALRPWINMNGAETETIIDQVRQCPSGALSYFINNDGPTDSDPSEVKEEIYRLYHGTSSKPLTATSS